MPTEIHRPPHSGDRLIVGQALQLPVENALLAIRHGGPRRTLTPALWRRDRSRCRFYIRWAPGSPAISIHRGIGRGCCS